VDDRIKSGHDDSELHKDPCAFSRRTHYRAVGRLYT